MVDKNNIDAYNFDEMKKALEDDTKQAQSLI